MLKEKTSKVKEKAVAAKEWLGENKDLLAYYAVMGGIAGGMVVTCIVTHNSNKKYLEAWRKAKEAFESNNMNHEFGPYKVMKFFEPTGEFIGQTMCHEGPMKKFLELK